MVKVYTVYHTDPVTHDKKEVGLVLERRKLDRENNFESLSKLARKLHPAPSPNIFISLD
jgi:hypothetical protein